MKVTTCFLVFFKLEICICNEGLLKELLHFLCQCWNFKFILMHSKRRAWNGYLYSVFFMNHDLIGWQINIYWIVHDHAKCNTLLNLRTYQIKKNCTRKKNSWNISFGVQLLTYNSWRTKEERREQSFFLSRKLFWCDESFEWFNFIALSAYFIVIRGLHYKINHYSLVLWP